MRSKRSASQSRWSAWIGVRPLSMRASTGTPLASAACSTASSSGIATRHLLLHRRVRGELERDDDQVGGDERRVLGARDPDRGVEHRRVERAAVNGTRIRATRSRRSMRGRRRSDGDARARRCGRDRSLEPERHRGSSSRSARSATTRMSMPGSSRTSRETSEPREDLAPARLVGRADEDVGRAALARDLLARSSTRSSPSLLEEVDAEDAREPPQRGERDASCSRRARARAAAPRARRSRRRAAAPSARRAAGSAASAAPASTSARIRSATACWLSGSSTVVLPPAPRRPRPARAGRARAAPRGCRCGRSSASAVSTRSGG